VFACVCCGLHYAHSGLHLRLSLSVLLSVACVFSGLHLRLSLSDCLCLLAYVVAIFTQGRLVLLCLQ